MNTSLEEGKLLAKQVEFLAREFDKDVTLIVAPPFTHLTEVKKIISDSKIQLSAQNCSVAESGAYTGEVSVKMLKSLGCEYVILGHSERREYFKESSEDLTKKINLALLQGLTPIYCVGEKLEERESNRHFEVVHDQLSEVLYHIKGIDFVKVIIAYEPVWAIGTGKTATTDQAQEMHSYIRRVLADKFGDLAESTTILYGGSCNPTNAKELFLQKDVDGGLIGGASLVANNFLEIAKSF